MKIKHFTTHFLFSIVFLFSSQFATAQLFINEFVASNDAGIADESGAFEDWVELYNASSTPIDIANYYLSDDLAEPTLWQIPATSPSETTIEAGGFLILWFDKDTEEGVLHIDAKLSGSGEDIVLTAPDGVTIIDSYSYGQQTTDVSEGRMTDGAAIFSFFTTQTPGATNAESTGVSPLPVFSISGGLYLNSQTVSISTAVPANVYYTTDGSEPDASSDLYTAPLNFSSPTPLRAISIATGAEASGIVTETYLIGVSHAYPIMAVTGNPSDFFDEETGIFGNYSEDIEIIINTEFYETDGTLGFNQRVESELVGVSSAENAQKSMALKAKGSLGSSKFDYPVFPDEELTEYRSLMLRNSGNDWSVTQFRDASVSSLIRDLSDVGDLISPPQINYQAYRPAIMYLNGEYWGIYNLRERSDRRYIKQRFDLDEDEIDFIENQDEVKEGDILNWDSLQVFLADNNFADEANYAELAERVDVDEFLDLMVYNIFIDKQDWPGNNNRRFRERSPEGKWHFLSYDIDFVFGLLTSAGWNTGFAGDNSLDRVMNPSDFSHPNPEWSARLFYKLLENENWRNNFINRTADQMNVLFLPTRISNRIDEFLTSFEPEIDQQLALWQNLYNQDANADLMKSFGNERTPVMQQDYIDAFSDIDNTVEISLSTQPAGAGSIEFSTLNVDEEDDASAWTGTYFTGIDIPVKAVAKPGFIFQYWEGISSDTSPEIVVNLIESGLLTAVFMEEGDVEPEAQTIDFTTIADQETTASPLTLNASATSGLPVSFSLVEGPATLSGNTLTLNGTAGLVIVQATQEGNATYAPATPVEREFMVFEPTYEVSFSVDMNDYDDTFTTVYLSGSFNGWSADANPMQDADNDGVWTTTIEVIAGTIEYNFQLDNGAVVEDLATTESCVNASGYREISIVSDTGIPTICWESCATCVGAPVVSAVTFSVDMNNYEDIFTTVFLSGSFNDWSANANPMEDADNDGVWTIEVELELGTQAYKFQLDEADEWEEITLQDCSNVDGNREIEVVGDATLPTVCWETCTACIEAPEVRNITLSVDMNNYENPFTTVFLSGDFNSWSTDANPMQDADNDGIWTTTVELEVGQQEYKFQLDESIVSESLEVTESCVNDAGHRETIVSEDMDVPVVCWETCAACIVAVEDIVASDLIFTLQPVPAQDYTTLIFKESYQTGAQIYITDALGRLIYTKTTTPSTQLQIIDTSTWAIGTYFVRVRSNNKMGVRRLLVTK